MTRVKICGITNTADAKACIELGADALGFLVGQGLPSARKFMDIGPAASIIESLPPFISTVMVTTLDNPEEIIKNALRTCVSTIQLHGNVGIEEIRRIREGLPHLKLYKVIHVYNEDVVPEAKSYDGEVDAIALDTAKADTGYVGGTGETHDWKLSKRVVESISIPVILAGGLNPDNIIFAIQAVGPYAVDVNSGVSNPDGTKDLEKVKQFIENVKQTH